MKVEKALLKDASCLTELTIRSKSYWNYTKEQIESWREDLKISAQYISINNVYKLVLAKKIIGFYSFSSEGKESVKLDFFFVEPAFIGLGCGKKMLSDFIKRVKKLHYKAVVLDADPNAEEFYKKNGFEVIGQLESSIKNRFLPIMELKLY